MIICGTDETKWNWQKRQTRIPYDRSQEQEYQQCVEALSHPELLSESIINAGGNSCGFFSIFTSASTGLCASISDSTNCLFKSPPILSDQTDEKVSEVEGVTLL